MIVTLDGHRLEGSFQTDCTLRALVDRVRDAHAGERLITAVRIDGQALSEAELSAQLDKVLAGDAQVDLESGERMGLVREALHGLALEFRRTCARCAELADRLSSDDVTGALHDVGDLIGVWQTCYRALAQSGELLGIDFTESPVAGRALHEHLSELLTHLTDVRHALEMRDLVLLADLVRHELPPLAQRWEGLMDALAEQLTSGAGAG